MQPMENNKPLISVIVPVYNAEKYLPRCINSILAQTFTDFELLLIDDGSKDKSGEICDDYGLKDSRVKVFHKRNGGVSSARNIGLDNASGEWVAFVDADDELLPLYFSKLIENSSEQDMVVGGYRQIGNNNKGISVLLEKIKVETAINGIFKNEGMEMLLFPWGKFFKMDLISKKHIRFNTALRLAEDFSFVLDYISEIDYISFVPYNNYLYRPNLPGTLKYVMDYDCFHRHCKTFQACLVRLENKKNISGENLRFKIFNIFFFKFFTYLKVCNKAKMNEECHKFMEQEGFNFIRYITKNRNIVFFFYIYLVIAFPNIGYYISKKHIN